MAYTAAGAMMPKRHEAQEIHITANPDPSNATMRTLQWYGTKEVRVVDHPKPAVTDAGDAVIKISSACICGSDLHLFLGAMPGMKKGDIMGHENMGIVESVGPEVQKIKPGDR